MVPHYQVPYKRSISNVFVEFNVKFTNLFNIIVSFDNTTACPQGWSVYNRKCFYWVEDKAYTAIEAKTVCSNLMPGGPVYRAKPDSNEESQFILSLIGWDGYGLIFYLLLLICFIHNCSIGPRFV